MATFETKGLTAQELEEKQKAVPGINWVDSTLSGVNLALTAIIQVVSYAPVPYLKQVASVALIIVNLTQGVKENKKLFRQLVEDVTVLVTAIGRSYIESPDREHWINEDLEINLAALVLTLNDIHKYTQEKHARSLKTRIFQNKTDIAKIKDFRSDINMAVARFDVQSHLNINQGLIKVAGNLHRRDKDQGEKSKGNSSTAGPQRPDKDHDGNTQAKPLALKDPYYQAALDLAAQHAEPENVECEGQEREEKERQEREEKEKREKEDLAEQARMREEAEAEKRRTEARKREEREKAEAKRKAEEEERLRLEEEREEARKRAEERKKAEARRKAEEERIRLEDERKERKRLEERKKRLEEKRIREEEERQRDEDLKKFLAQKAANKRAELPTRKASVETEDEDEGEDESESSEQESQDEWVDDDSPITLKPERRQPKLKHRAEASGEGHFESINVNSNGPQKPKRKPKPGTYSHPGRESPHPPRYSPQPMPFYPQYHGYHTPPPNPAPSPLGLDLNAMMGSVLAQSLSGATVVNIGSGNTSGNTYRNVNNTHDTEPRRRRRRYDSDEDDSDDG